MFGNFTKPIVKVTKKIDLLGDVVAALQKVEKDNVMLGIPAATNPRKGDPINNAQLGYILAHGVERDEKETATPLQAYKTENGDPLHRIPPRPFLDPAVIANKDIIAQQQAKVIQAAMNGSPTEVDTQMTRLGLLGQSLIKNWFTDPRNGWAPNAPSTIKKKGSDNPMIDTGALRNSITYVVRPAK